MKRDTNIKYLSLPILILFIYFGNPEKCEHMTIFLIPDNHTGKLSSKRFRLQFSTHHIKLVKINENQSIINKKLNLIFRKNVTMDCCDPDETLADTKDCLSDTTAVISKLIGMRFRKLPRNICYLTFPPWWAKLCSMHRGGRKFKPFSAGSGFTGQSFTWETKLLILYYFDVLLYISDYEIRLW